ncbi:Na+/H+ antiporter subunit E [Sorangium sp. So ce315]|uniref:Na+/H+ antiporter subunit E n=1 Tax=Sorangium sp. So ce315 TaxID=3133299 RepID=UPI003F638E78
MSPLAQNLLLALAWVCLTGDFSLRGLLIGAFLGFLGLTFGQRAPRGRRYTRAVRGSLRLLGSFLWQLVLANLQLARDVLRRELPFRPQLLRLDVRDLGRTQVVLLGNLISLTPGTITVDAEDDGATLLVHTLYAEDPEAVRGDLRALAELILRASGSAPPPPGPPASPPLPPPSPPEERR